MGPIRYAAPIVLSAAAWLAASGCQAQAVVGRTGSVHDARFNDAIRIGQALAERRISEGVPGFSVAVAIEGEVVWAEGFGVADLETGREVTPGTRFRIGSTSKAVTSALAGRLIDADRVNLDSDVRTYLPSFPAKRWTLTLRDLLSNQGGVRHYRHGEPLSRTHYGSVEAGLSVFEADTLLFEPHTYAHYSSYGFNLAGAALASVEGLSFGDLLEREVFGPLGMHASGVDDPTVDIPERARFYTDGSAPAPEVDDAYKAPSGGLLSTPTDLVRFGSGLLGHLEVGDGPWITPRTVETLITPRDLADGRSTGYALGFRVQAADRDATPPLPYAVHHGGSSVGARSMLYLLPDYGVVVSLLANTDDYDDKEDDAAAIGDAFVASLPR